MKYFIALVFVFLTSICSNIVAQNSKNMDSTALSINTVVTDMDASTLMKTGTFVPDFTLTTLDGKEIKLSKLKGKTVLLNFFTLSCPSCMKELPLIEKEIWQKYKNNIDIVILMVGREEPVKKLISFREKKKFTFPIASDPKREVYALFAKQFVPRNIVIDKEGKLALSEVGFTEDKAEKLFQKIENELTR